VALLLTVHTFSNPSLVLCVFITYGIGELLKVLLEAAITKFLILILLERAILIAVLINW